MPFLEQGNFVSVEVTSGYKQCKHAEGTNPLRVSYQNTSHPAAVLVSVLSQLLTRIVQAPREATPRF